jgi:hypothetical protein
MGIFKDIETNSLIVQKLYSIQNNNFLKMNIDLQD